MYTSYFGLSALPFSITPDPRYLYMSRRYREAMAHLLYVVQDGGGFVQLTGEVGTGKTTLCRCFLEQLPENVEVALILNPKVSEHELLAGICDELKISYPKSGSIKDLLDCINTHLLNMHAQDRRTVLIVDEAQNLSREVLEQIRLLTNLETPKHKLLRIVLIGQPELVDALARSDLRQLAQRITARYHLSPLSAVETAEYIKHRLAVAGCNRPLFSKAALRKVYKASAGVPRLVNVICDRALLGAYSQEKLVVNSSMVVAAAAEVFGASPRKWAIRAAVWAPLLLVGALLPVLWKFQPHLMGLIPVQTKASIMEWSGAPTMLPEESDTANEVRDDVELGRAPEEISQSVTHAASEAPDNLALGEIPQHATQPVVAVEPVSLDELLADPGISGDYVAAIDRLVKLWGLALDVPSVDAVCEDTKRVGLECLEGKGTWNSLRRYNRAAVLVLQEPGGSNRYALLTAMAGERASLNIGGEEFEFPLLAVDRYWNGKYMLLWRPPPLQTQTVSQRSRGDDVVWLREAMDLLSENADAASLSDSESRVFDDELRDRVRRFQRRHALPDDGIVGVETLIRLNTALHSGAIPLLVN